MTEEKQNAVGEIVARLTKSQRAAMLLHDNWMMDDLARDKPGIARQLHDLGLTYVELSPFGEDVRAHLKAALASTDRELEA